MGPAFWLITGLVWAQDADEDGVLDDEDVCPAVADPEQEDRDQDGFGDLCDLCLFVSSLDNQDSDGDTVGDACDNCPADANSDQEDLDEDGMGSPCDPEFDEGGSCGPGCAQDRSMASLGLLLGVALRSRRQARGQGSL